MRGDSQFHQQLSTADKLSNWAPEAQHLTTRLSKGRGQRRRLIIALSLRRLAGRGQPAHLSIASRLGADVAADVAGILLFTMLFTVVGPRSAVALPVDHYAAPHRKLVFWGVGLPPGWAVIGAEGHSIRSMRSPVPETPYPI